MFNRQQTMKARRLERRAILDPISKLATEKTGIKYALEAEKT